MHSTLYSPDKVSPGEINGATVHWNAAIKESLYGPTARGQLDGEYLDSLELGGGHQDYRREHFAAADWHAAAHSSGQRLDLYGACLDQAACHQAALAKTRAAVAVAHLVLFLRQVEHLAGVAQNQLVGLVAGRFERCQLQVSRQGAVQCAKLAEIGSPVLLALIRDALRDDAFHRETGLGRVSSGGEGFEASTQKSGFREAALRLGEHDVGRDQSLVPSLIPFEQRNHRADAGIDFFAAGRYTVADIALYAYTHTANESVFDLTGFPSIRIAQALWETDLIQIFSPKSFG